MSHLDQIDIVLAAIRAHTRVLKLPTIARECDVLARGANPAFLFICAWTLADEIANSPNARAKTTNFFEFIEGRF